MPRFSQRMPPAVLDITEGTLVRRDLSHAPRADALLVTVGLATSGLAAAVPAAADETPPDATVKSGVAGDKLGEHDRELLAQARADGEEEVTIIVATAEGKSRSVDDSVRRLGG